MTTPGEDLHADLDTGWLLPPAAAREAVHTRSIVCRSFRRDDGLLEVDARFIDTRPFAYASEFRGECAPGAALHNLQLRVTVDRTRHVVALVSAMPGTPYGGCAEVNANFQHIVGLSMGRGFKRALRDRLGGTQGCTHMLALLEATAAAVVQAFASNAHLPERPGQPAPVRVFRRESLLDSCWSYRADGPVMRELEALERNPAR